MLSDRKTASRKIVGHEQDCWLGTLQNLHEIEPHLPCGDGVEMAERLVHQQNIRLDGERAGNGDPLLHAPRQVQRVIPLLPGKSDHFQILCDQLLPSMPRHVLRLENKVDVVLDGQPVEQSRALEDIADARFRAGPARFRMKVTVPPSYDSMPAMTFKNVDFPQPDGPTILTNLPSSTVETDVMEDDELVARRVSSLRQRSGPSQKRPSPTIINQAINREITFGDQSLEDLNLLSS